MPESPKNKKPLRESILFFAVFIGVGLLAFSFPLFAKLLGAGWAILFLIVRNFFMLGLLIWAGWMFWRWLKTGGDRNDR